MSKIETLTDDELLKWSGHAGRNLIALAILMTLSAILLILPAILLERENAHVPIRSGTDLLSAFAWVFPLVLSLAAAGLWTLAVAARRGNPTSVGIVLVVLFFQVLLALIGFVISFIQQNQQPNVGIVGVLIGLAVVAAVAKSRNVLIEMKKRGLWQARFGLAKASGHLCIVGGILLVVGYLGLNASLLIPAVAAARTAKERAKEMQQAKAFFAIVKGEEAELMNALREPGGLGDSGAIKTALSKVDALERKVISLQSGVADNEPLFPILTKYRRAISDWKSGLTAFDSSAPDRDKAKGFFESGDRLRTEAADEFDRRYVHP